MNKRILISLSVIGAVAAIAIGGTIAYFSDTETSIGNKFVAGKFNLKIDNTCEYNGKVCSKVGDVYLWEGTQEPCFCTWEEKDLAGELYFNLLDVKPGDNGEDTISLHVDNNDAWMCAQVANLINQDNGCESPENKLDTTCDNPGVGQGELQDNLFFSVFKDYNCDNIKNGDDYYVVQDQPAQAGFWPIADSQHGPAIPGGATICYGVKWNVPLAATNVIQTDSLFGDVIFTAVQARHMDTFICSDLTPTTCVSTPEVCDGIDNDCDQAIDEGELWMNKGQSCFVGQGICQASGTYICNAGNPAGSTICSANAGTPGTETCNGLDDDCDGQVDEGNPGGGGSCSTGLQGICSAGTLQCLSGALSCTQTYQSGTETCNGLDDDCDGQVDEDGASLCNDGLYCNGTETCSAGVCMHAGNPCPGQDVGPMCNDSCNEANNNCTANDFNGCSCPGGLCIDGVCIQQTTVHLNPNYGYDTTGIDSNYVLVGTDLTKLAASDDSRYQSHLSWQSSLYQSPDEYIEFGFPDIPAGATINSVNLSFEWQRSDFITYAAQLQIYDGSTWTTHTLNLPAASTDVLVTVDLKSLYGIDTAAEVNALRIWFQAQSSWWTRHDWVQVDVTYIL